MRNRRIKRIRFSFLCFLAIILLILPGKAAGEGEADDAAPEMEDRSEETESNAVFETPESSEQTAPPAITLEEISEVPLDDITEDAACRSAVSYVVSQGYLPCADGNCFDPDALMTRQQTISVLRRLASRIGANSDDAEDDIQWAVHASVLKGTQSGDYAEDAPITRIQLAAFLYRLVQYAGYGVICTDGYSRYPDADSVADYGREALAWAVEHGMFDGVIFDSLYPNLAVSRAQTAMIITSFIAYITAEPVAVEISEAIEPYPSPTSASRENHAQIQEHINSIAGRYGASGLQVAVVENGHVTDSFAYGWATRNVDSMTADHKMRIASISKVVIGMNVMRMCQDYLIDLDMPVGIYWDANFQNPYYPDQPVTARSILTHTSSIVIGEASAAKSYEAVRQRQQSSAGYSRTMPGALSSWGYNNYAFSVLGMTAELAADKTLDQMLRQYFFDIMEIDASFYAGDIKDAARLVTLSGNDGSVRRSIPVQISQHAGAPGSNGSSFAGGLTISANDLAKVVALLAANGEFEGLRLLQPGSVEMMETFEDRKVSGGFYQALPLRYRENICGRDGLYYHTGSAYGVYNCLSYDPETGDGVVVLTVGASAATDQYGIYAVCGNIMNYIYDVIER